MGSSRGRPGRGSSCCCPCFASRPARAEFLVDGVILSAQSSPRPGVRGETLARLVVRPMMTNEAAGIGRTPRGSGDQDAVARTGGLAMPGRERKKNNTPAGRIPAALGLAAKGRIPRVGLDTLRAFHA